MNPNDKCGADFVKLVEQMREHRSGRDYVRSRLAGLIDEAPIGSMEFVRGMAQELGELSRTLEGASFAQEQARAYGLVQR